VHISVLLYHFIEIKKKCVLLAPYKSVSRVVFLSSEPKNMAAQQIICIWCNKPGTFAYHYGQFSDPLCTACDESGVVEAYDAEVKKREAKDHAIGLKYKAEKALQACHEQCSSAKKTHLWPVRERRKRSIQTGVPSVCSVCSLFGRGRER